MLGIRKAFTSDLSQKIQELERQLDDERRRYRSELETLKKQLVRMAQGHTLSEKAILKGLLYNDVTPEEMGSFLTIQNLLVLDVRSDKEWDTGYIPNAKHIPVDQLLPRLGELSDKTRPILAVCASGGRSASAAELLTQNGYMNVHNAVGGMGAYEGDLAFPEKEPMDASGVEGDDRDLIEKVIVVLDRDVRPNLQRDGGDVTLLAVKDGIADLKMIGACHGCGSQKVTVEQGIKNHLIEAVPGIVGVRDLS